MFDDSFRTEGYGWDSDDWWRVIGYVIVIAFALLIECRGYLVDSPIAQRALETQGYSDVTITEKHYFLVGLQGCDAKDAAKFDAEAVNPRGQKVDLFVCTGWLFKGATVRTK